MKLSDVILFSAAIPYQQGMNHINTQWQDYWQTLFEKNNYLPILTLRKKIWDHKDVAFFYKQNISVYAKEETINQSVILLHDYQVSKNIPMSMVHPDCYISTPEKSFSEDMTFHLKRRVNKIVNKILGNR